MSLPYLQDMLQLEADQYLQKEIANLLVPFEQGNNAVTLGPSSMAYSLLQQLKAAIFEERRHENRLRFLNSFLADVAVTRRIRREDAREPKPQADVSDVSGEPAAHSEPVPRMTPMPQVIKSKSLDKEYEMNGSELIAAERQRQIEVEGYRSSNDDGYRDGQLVKAAIAYLINVVPCGLGSGSQFWPWRKEFWKPYSQRANLIRAGALIAAELDRLDRERNREANDTSQP